MVDHEELGSGDNGLPKTNRKRNVRIGVGVLALVVVGGGVTAAIMLSHSGAGASSGGGAAGAASRGPNTTWQTGTPTGYYTGQLSFFDQNTLQSDVLGILEDGYQLKFTGVTCPAGVPDIPGQQVTCTAHLDNGTSKKVAVTIDGHGGFQAALSQ